MLAVYPIAATAENWVHVAIHGKIQSALNALNAGDDIAPWNEGLAAELQNRDALIAGYEKFCDCARRLSAKQREKILSIMECQNNIPAVYDGATACPSIDDLPSKIRAATKQIYDAGFEALKSLKIRDRQYQAIFSTIKICPFCGIEPFEAPGLAREDLDHYLPKHKYPFASANLRNLAPMGGKCNSSYKTVRDVIVDADDNRCRCFDPYGADVVTVSLEGSRPFEGEIVDLVPIPAWQFQFTGHLSEIQTWDRVFQIRRRYEGKVSAHFRDWIEHFAFWCEREVGLIDTGPAVVGALQRYISVMLDKERGEGSHLKRAMFSMLRQCCEVGDVTERLSDWFSQLVRGQRQLMVG